MLTRPLARGRVRATSHRPGAATGTAGWVAHDRRVVRLAEEEGPIALRRARVPAHVGQAWAEQGQEGSVGCGGDQTLGRGGKVPGMGIGHRGGRYLGG